MQFVKASLVYLVLGALIAAGIVVMAAKGSFSLLILSVGLFMGLFIKYGCLTSND